MSAFQNIDWVNVGSIAAAPVTGVLSYFAGKKKRKNDFLQNLQTSIDLLAGKNAELLKELLEVKKQNIKLSVAVEQLKLENEQLKVTIQTLTTQLENVKVITKVEKPHD